MSPGEVFDALGGGLVGLLGVVIMLLASLLFWELKGQIKELRDGNKELREAVNRLADVIESWTPDGQRRRLRQP